MYDEQEDWRLRILGALRQLKEDYRRDGLESPRSKSGEDTMPRTRGAGRNS